MIEHEDVRVSQISKFMLIAEQAIINGFRTTFSGLAGTEFQRDRQIFSSAKGLHYGPCLGVEPVPGNCKL